MQRHPGNAPTINIRTICAKIDDFPPTRFAAQFNMMAGDDRAIQYNLILGRSADPNYCRRIKRPAL
jgi:hypothetical protein